MSSVCEQCVQSMKGKKRNEKWCGDRGVGGGEEEMSLQARTCQAGERYPDILKRRICSGSAASLVFKM